MIRKYIYKEKAYFSTYALRQELFKQERKAIAWPDPSIGVEKMNEALNKHGITYTEEPDPEPTDEQLAQDARRRRDALIAASDFYMMPDYPSDPKALESVKTYRQALRDISAQEGFPKAVEWPTCPTVLLKQPAKSRMLRGLRASTTVDIFGTAHE